MARCISAGGVSSVGSSWPRQRSISSRLSRIYSSSDFIEPPAEWLPGEAYSSRDQGSQIKAVLVIFRSKYNLAIAATYYVDQVRQQSRAAAKSPKLDHIIPTDHLRAQNPLIIYTLIVR